MIIKTEADLRVLDVLCENCFSCLSIYEIAGLSSLSHTWVYRVVENLKKHNFIISENKRMRINLENKLAAKFREVLDMEKIYEMDLGKEILDIFRIIRENYADELISLCLVGSVARMKYRKGSDIDFLLITKKRKRQEYEKFGLTDYENINIIELTPREFNEKYLATDDFIISSLSSLLILLDNDFIIKYLQKPLPFPSMDIIRKRIRQLNVSREGIITNLKIRDYGNVRKGLIELLVQLVRIRLFQNNIMPKSKYELAEQIKPINREMAKDLDLLLTAKIPNKKLIKMGGKYGFQNYRGI